MLMLTPKKDAEVLTIIKTAAGQKQIPWEKILYQANRHMCTPLWYAQLKNDKLLSCLPDDLVEYLEQLYQANLDRNLQLKTGLIQLLQEFNRAAIQTLLLKGAATFCDQLFEADGSRFMGDLDILVPEDQVEQSRSILIKLGYKEIPDEGMELDELPTDERHHQLPRYYIPGTPIVVEIHFKISYALVGRLITPASAWQDRTQSTLKGEATSVLSPDHKLLLNTAHAMIPHREYLRGHISPLQLSEFVLLAQRYSDSINWQKWLNTARQFSLSDEFMTYLDLSVNFMGLTKPKVLSSISASQFSKNRIIFMANYVTTIKFDSIPLQKKITHHFYRIYYYAKLPLWLWQNLCYAPGWKNIPIRILFCLKKITSTHSWKRL